MLGTLIHTQMQQKMVILIVSLLLLTGIMEALTDVDAMFSSRVAWSTELNRMHVLSIMAERDIKLEPFRSVLKH